MVRTLPRLIVVQDGLYELVQLAAGLGESERLLLQALERDRVPIRRIGPRVYLLGSVITQWLESREVATAG